MGENLNVDRFNNGDLIPYIEDQDEWENAGKSGSPAWCYYNNDPENGEIFGRLYNWYALTDPRGIAPKGWSIPDEQDWTELFEVLGGEESAYVNLKSTISWGEDVIASNESGFTALPAGYRNDIDGFIGGSNEEELENMYTAWWSSSEIEENSSYATYRGIVYNFDGFVQWIYPKSYGLSVRCIKKD